MRISASPILILGGLLICTAPLAAQDDAAGRAADADRFGIDAAIDLNRVADPQLSPDGTRVLFTRSELDWDKNKRVSRIWIAEADGSDARAYTSGEGDGSPRWSPDGRWVAFTRSVGEKDKVRQLFLLRTGGGEAVQLTRHPTAVGRFEWTRDSRRIVFVAADSLGKDEKAEFEKGADAILVDEPPNGQGRSSWQNLWWVAADPDSGTARPITEGERRIGNFAASPDGRRVAFAYRVENGRNGGYRSELAVVDVAGGEIRRLTENEAPESNLAWSPDGRTLTFMAPDLETWELAQGNLYAMDVATAEVRRLGGAFEGDIRGYEWSPDGRSIQLVAMERTVANLYRLDVVGGAVSRLSAVEGVLGDASFSADHRRAAFMISTPTEPGDVYTSELSGFSPVRVTDANPATRSWTLASPEVVRWTSRDGLEIEGLLYRPPGTRASPGALVLHIHGGPASVFSRGFNADAQILAAQGYAVLQPNVRGSTGYGDAFLRGNVNDIGGGDYEDLMTGVDAMIERGIAHPDSLAVKGWSYGGILGGWTITQTNRFRAASLGAMVADWRSEFGAGFNFDVVRWYIGGDPWTNREEWLARSSYTYLDRVRTPTILFHGENDTTCTVEQTMNFHAGLRRLGVPVRFLRFPREGHGITEPRHARARMVEEVRWFQMHVRGDADWQAPERPAETEVVAAQ